MNWIRGTDRSQRHLLPACVEDYVGPDNPVRFLDAFVDQLDLRALGFVFPKDNAQDRGRPAYPPAALLKLYLYGYLNQVRSSRRLRAECQRNLEVIWLLEQRVPCHKTIADFRKDNAGVIKQALREFTRTCQRLELFGGELIVIDGCHMKGQNSPDKNWTLNRLEAEMKELDKRLEEYLGALDQADQQEGPLPRGLSAKELNEKIERLKAKQTQVQARLEVMAQSKERQLSATDSQSRRLQKGRQAVVGYNIQAAVDAKHHLIGVTEVTNSSADQGQLQPMVQATVAELGIPPAVVAVDGGYFDSQDIKACQDQGWSVHVPVPNNSPSARAKRFGKEAFQYEASSNTYRCPAGATLKYRRTHEDKGRLVFDYENRAACRECAIRKRCTPKDARTVSRWEHEESLEKLAEQMAASPETLPRRKTIIEHCWGTLRWLLPGGFLVRGLVKVGAEVSLAQFAYNFKRALKVVGLQRLLEAVAPA